MRAERATEYRDRERRETEAEIERERVCLFV